MLHVEWLNFEGNDEMRGIWDRTMLCDILDELDKYGTDRTDRVIFVVHGKQTEYEKINKEINDWKKVLVIVTSDEESLFDTDKLHHPDMIIYSQYPTTEKSKNVDFWLPIGYTPHIRPNLKKYGYREKDLDWFFSGQVTHKSRELLYEQLKDLPNGKLLGTEGFTQGLSHDTYDALMLQAKVVPSPSGVVKPEAFRTYEALEAGAVPIAQGYNYHEFLFGEMPILFVEGWAGIQDHINHRAEQFPKLNNLVQSWWLQQKRMIKQRFIKDLKLEIDDPTVIITTSPIPTNPDTSVIEKVVDSIRNHLPDAEILILADGVRKEQKHLEANYQKYLRKLLWLANLEWHNTTVIVHQNHLHQLEMTRRALDLVTTDLIFFCEHDMPLNDKDMYFNIHKKVIRDNKLDLVRFYLDAEVPEAHKHLMLNQVEYEAMDYIPTGQWSQRPHLAKTDFYRQVLKKYASDKANCMIEDALHGHIADCFVKYGKAGWNKHKLAIYVPLEGDLATAYHIDGRLNESKFEKEMVF